MRGETANATERQTHILDVAQNVFIHYGYKRATLEDIAQAAGLSRTGLYHHFAGKEELFRAVTERTHRTAREDALAAASADGALADVLLATLDAVLGSFVEIVRTARHGRELVDETNRVCADIAAATVVAHRAAVTQVLAAAQEAGDVDLGSSGFDAATAASYLIASAQAIAGFVSGPDVRADYRMHLARLVRVWLRGLAPAEPSPTGEH